MIGKSDQHPVHGRDREAPFHVTTQEGDRARNGNRQEGGDDEPGDGLLEEVDEVRGDEDHDHDHADPQDRADARVEASEDGHHRRPLRRRLLLSYALGCLGTKALVRLTYSA